VVAAALEVIVTRSRLELNPLLRACPIQQGILVCQV
jgi:hypothetical protein